LIDLVEKELVEEKAAALAEWYKTASRLLTSSAGGRWARI
jgi:hypothetical protein